MKVAIVGTGYVGLVSGTCFAEMGHKVTCIDTDEAKVAMLKESKSPIYEPGLEEMLKRNIKAKRLEFSTNYSSVAKAQTIFLAVGTPSAEDGQANLNYLEMAALSVAKELSDGAIVVIKSTVPIGTSDMIYELMTKNTQKKFYLVNNPEFLKEGAAIDDFMKPDRVVIGCKDPYAARIMQDLYAPLVLQGNPIYLMSNISAELTKYAANCFLATKISFINEMSRLCDRVGADIEEVRRGITSDRRIGAHFLYAGPGYGGSCFPKDVKALMYSAKKLGVSLKIVEAAEEVNKDQKIVMAKKIEGHFKSDLKGRTLTFWGVSFKPNTDDVREAPSIDMARYLCQRGADIRFYDPVASEGFLKAMKSFPETKGKIHAFDDKYEALNHSDGLVIMTEWREFRFPDFEAMRQKMKSGVIFDARNVYNPQYVIDEGFHYYAIGKVIPSSKSQEN